MTPVAAEPGLRGALTSANVTASWSECVFASRTREGGACQEYEVDHGTLHEAAKIVRDTKEELRTGDLVNLRGAVEDLLVAWQGEAGSAFQSVAQRWNDDCGKLLHAMDVIADLLDKSATRSRSPMRRRATP